MACLKFFQIVSHMQSGWNKVGSPTGLAGFCSNISHATFHWVGNTLLFNAELKTASSILILAWCTIVYTLLGIPSGPSAFLAMVQIRSTVVLIFAAFNSGGPSQLLRVRPPVLGAMGTADPWFFPQLLAPFARLWRGGGKFRPFSSQSCMVVQKVPPPPGCNLL